MAKKFIHLKEKRLKGTILASKTGCKASYFFTVCICVLPWWLTQMVCGGLVSLVWWREGSSSWLLLWSLHDSCWQQRAMWHHWRRFRTRYTHTHCTLHTCGYRWLRDCARIVVSEVGGLGDGVRNGVRADWNGRHIVVGLVWCYWVHGFHWFH